LLACLLNAVAEGPLLGQVGLAMFAFGG